MMTQNFDTGRTALIAVDFQDECMRPSGAWPVVDAERTLANAGRVLEACRRRGIPIIYTRHLLEPDGRNAFRYEPLSDAGQPLHSVAGSPMEHICPEVSPAATDIIVDKQRWTGFYCTQMDLYLNRLDVDHLIMMGVWTEACFETTVWDALWRDYRITVVKDACTSASRAMHMTAILDMANWLCGGMIIRTDEIVKALNGADYTAWRYRAASEFVYELHNIEQLYDSI